MRLRNKLIINELFYRDKVDLDELASLLKVSSRTIRLDIERINAYLIDKDLDVEVILKNNVISLQGDEDSNKRLKTLISESDYYNYKLNLEERRALIALEILFSDSFVTMDELASKFQVSKSTIQSDLNEVRDNFTNLGIELISKKGKGLYVECAELENRQAIQMIISESLTNVLDIDDELHTLTSMLYEEIEIDTIKSIIIEAENKFSYKLTNISFEGLLLHIVLSIKRSQTESNKSISNDYDFGSDIDKNSVEYKISSYIYQEINHKLNVNLPPQEIDYFTYHLFDRPLMAYRLNDGEGVASNWLKVQLLVFDLITSVENKLKIDLSKDLQLYEGLYAHLGPALNRIKEKKIMRNPLKKELIDSYGDLYAVLKTSTKSIEDYTKVELEDDELTYLLIHFAAAIERNRENKAKLPDILIVCSTGAATAQLIIEKISKIFRFNVVGVVSLHQVSEIVLKENVDLIVSSVNLTTKTPYVVVSPLIKEEDIRNIHSLIQSLGYSVNYKKREKQDVNLYEIVDIILKDGHVVNEKVLLRNLENYFLEKNIEVSKMIETEKIQPMLSELLKTDNIRLNVKANNWEDAIRASGQPLLERGAIDESYIDNTISNVKELGPYIVITKGVAIPHASASSGVNKTAISLISLKEAVEFGSEQNDPVKYVFMLSTVDMNEHLKALTDLVEILAYEEFYQVIEQATQASEVYEYIVSFEEEREGRD